MILSSVQFGDKVNTVASFTQKIIFYQLLYYIHVRYLHERKYLRLNI